MVISYLLSIILKFHTSKFPMFLYFSLFFYSPLSDRYWFAVLSNLCLCCSQGLCFFDFFRSSIPHATCISGKTGLCGFIYAEINDLTGLHNTRTRQKECKLLCWRLLMVWYFGEKMAAIPKRINWVIFV